jgi:hypothetical protein
MIEPRGAGRWQGAGLRCRTAQRRGRCRNEVRRPKADPRGDRPSGVVRRANSSPGWAPKNGQDCVGSTRIGPFSESAAVNLR